MRFNLVLQNIAKHIRLSPEEQEVFTSKLKIQTLKRKELLLQEGDICHFSAFIQSGCLRSYTLHKNGSEHVLGFAPMDWWMADMYSLISQKPGMLYIEAIEPTEIVLLYKSDQERLYSEIPKFERFFRIIAENALVSSQQRLLDNLSLSAQERYQQFCNKFPMLVSKIPNKQIASYIGVTPEFFSKMIHGRNS